MELGIASVAAITAIAYLLGMAVKATSVADKWIPIICGAAGLILGVVAWAMGVPDYPAHDWLNAAAVGIVSGWAATGLNQSVKQLTKYSCFYGDPRRLASGDLCVFAQLLNQFLCIFLRQMSVKTFDICAH